MTQISSSVNLPLLSKTQSPGNLEEASRRFLSLTSLQPRNLPRSLSIFGKGELVVAIFNRLAEMELPGKAYVQRYLLDMNRRNLKGEENLTDVLK